MPTYGYIRTSRDQEPGHPGSDPHVQHRQLVEAGVDHARIYADVATSGAKDYKSREQWHLLDQQLALVLQRQFKVGCPGMRAKRLGVWRASDWPAHYYPASPRATAATQLARTVPGAASPVPLGTLGVW